MKLKTKCTWFEKSNPKNFSSTLCSHKGFWCCVFLTLLRISFIINQISCVDFHSRVLKQDCLPPTKSLSFLRWEDFRLDSLTIYDLIDISYFACQQHIASPVTQTKDFQNENQPPQTQMQSKQEQAKLHQSLHKKNEYKIMYFNQGVDKAFPCISGLN